MAKKTTNTKTAKKKNKINDEKALMEEMKKMALQSTEEYKENNKKEIDVKSSKDETVEEKNDNVQQLEQIEENVIVEEKENISSDDMTKDLQQNEQMDETITDIIEDDEEDLSFIESIKEEIKEVEKEKQREDTDENKSTRTTYQDMFDYTWCGYGYTEF